MGTNYYVAKDKCKCCNRFEKEYHIGKSSIGWVFCFQGQWNKLTSWKNWKEFLKDQMIVNEYGEEIPYDEFVLLIENHKKPDGKLKQHNDYCRNNPPVGFDFDEHWDDDEGYPFAAHEFS